MNNAELLAAWDRGDEVTLVEMGGISADYEMAIQLAAMELLRSLDEKPIEEQDNDPKRFAAELDNRLLSINATLGYGVSGAQAGAIQNIAWLFHKHGYETVLQMAPEDRRIKLRKVPFKKEPS